MTSLAGMVCEVRVPTYRRPKLLDRALRSVCAQTHADWRCIVFDDCPDGSAAEIVEAVGDPRISYRRNPASLRAIGNIDQCFRNAPYDQGLYACVLEDDNYLLPEHLQRQLERCAEHSVEVAFTAQACEEVLVPGEPGVLGEDKTIVAIYPEGAHQPAKMLPAILYSHAFSNGSVFWRLGGASDFEMAGVTARPGVQETARIFGLKAAVHVSHQPTAVWRWNDPRDSYVSARLGHDRIALMKERWAQLLERREIMALRRWYLRSVGTDQALLLAQTITPEQRNAMENALLMCGQYAAISDRSFIWRLSWMVRGFAFRLVVPNRIVWPRP